MAKIAKSLLVGSLAVLGWAYAGYPAVLFLVDRRRADRPPDLEARPTPHVTVVVGVYNEEDSIEAKLANIFELEYPHNLLDVLVASDGSVDATNTLVENYPDDRVRLFAHPARRGRALMTNDVVKATTAEWLLFTDADTRMERDFLQRMLPHLALADIGVLDGSMRCVNRLETSITRDVGLYWRYESMLKRLESRAGVLASTFGACTLVRRTVFRPLLPTEDVDFTTPLDAAATGRRTVHEPTAVVHEFAHAEIGEQFRARRRMVAKNLPGTVRKLPELTHRPALVAAIVSHKLLRWTTPVWLATALIANIVAARRSRRCQLVLAAQAAFYGAGVVGLAGGNRGRQMRVGSTVASYLVANAGFAAGLFSAARGTKITTWEPLRGVTADERST